MPVKCESFVFGRGKFNLDLQKDLIGSIVDRLSAEELFDSFPTLRSMSKRNFSCKYYIKVKK